MAVTAALWGCGGSSSNSNTITPAAVLTSVSLTPTAASINVGAYSQFLATANYSDESTKDVTGQASWSSTDSTVASIETEGQTNPGRVTAVAPGNVNITAKYQGVSGVTTLNVTGLNGTLTSFYVSPQDSTIAPGATRQMFSYGRYSDGTAKWVTGSTSFSSSDPSIASVEDQGQASPGLVTAGTTPGTTTITATFGGFKKSTTLTVTPNAVPIALMDMTSSQQYLSLQGGLYENVSDTVPTDHDAAGKAAAAEIQPLDQNGLPNAAGAVVFVGIGMSNATEEFSSFVSEAAANSGVNHTTLAVEDGAEGSATACYWTVAQGQTLTACPEATGTLIDNQYDRVRDSVLAIATTAPSAPAGCGAPPSTPCLTEAQVQVLWIKNANPMPAISNKGTLCDETVSGCVNDTTKEAVYYESQLGQIIRAAKSRYPNLKQIFLSTRIYAGYATIGLNPEPYAYEYGFSAKWLIEAQIVQERNGTVDPVAGDLSYDSGTAVWTAWGTYLWANGSQARSDGTFYLASDFQSDGTHPDTSGIAKVDNLLMNYFLSSPYTPWFRP